MNTIASEKNKLLYMRKFQLLISPRTVGMDSYLLRFIPCQVLVKSKLLELSAKWSFVASSNFRNLSGP